MIIYKQSLFLAEEQTQCVHSGLMTVVDTADPHKSTHGMRNGSREREGQMGEGRKVSGSEFWIRVCSWIYVL